MTKTLKEVNEGSLFLNNWVYEQTKALLEKNNWLEFLVETIVHRLVISKPWEKSTATLESCR